MKILPYFVFVVFVLAEEGKNYYGKPGQTIKIACGAKTLNKDVTWSLGDQLLLKINGKSGVISKGSVRVGALSRIKVKGEYLVIDSLESEDTGIYTCKVEETNYQHRLYILKVSASPSSHLQKGGQGTLSCQVEGAEPLPEVKWVPPNGRPEGATQSWKVELNPVALSDEGAWSCQLSLNDDIQSEILNLKVEASQGIPPPVPSTNPEHDNDRSPGTGLDQEKEKGVVVKEFKLWVWMVVGACCLVLVSLVVLTILAHRRNRRMRRAQRLTTRKPLKPNDYCQCKGRPAVIAPPQGKREKPSPLRLQQR